MKKLQLIFKYIQGNIPEIISNNYNENIERNHFRTLRNNQNFPIVRYFNNTASKHLYNNTPLWNELSEEIKNKNSLITFTKFLKQKYLY